MYKRLMHLSFQIFEILIQNGCNVDYCSTANNYPRITDAFVASLNFDPGCSILMIPYSLYCDPGTLIEVAANNGILDNMPLQVSYCPLLTKLKKKEEVISYVACFFFVTT